MPIGNKLATAVGRLFGGLFSPALDKTKVFGLENLPEAGFLLLPNNLIGRDVVLLQSACPRPIRYILGESVYRAEPRNRFLRSRSSITTMPSVRTEEAICEVANRIRKGEVVCIVPGFTASSTKACMVSTLLNSGIGVSHWQVIIWETRALPKRPRKHLIMWFPLPAKWLDSSTAIAQRPAM